MGLRVCPVVTRGDHDPEMCKRAGETVSAAGSHTPLDAALVLIMYFPLTLTKMEMEVLWLVGLSIHVLGLGDIGTWGDTGTCNHSFSPRQETEEVKKRANQGCNRIFPMHRWCN